MNDLSPDRISESLKNQTLPESGIYSFCKPAGIGSFDVIRNIKRSLKLPRKFKIGHFGTLDPFADGLLLVGLGRSTKLNQYIHSELPKTYRAIGQFGKLMDTGDLTGEVIGEDETDYIFQFLNKISQEELESLLIDKFLGDYWQVPHAFSATKFEGKKLHEWAREGVIVKKDPVFRTIHSLKIHQVVLNPSSCELDFSVEVSSGTYIRSLFEDIAKFLGGVGHLKTLTRTLIGDIDLKNAIKLEDLKSNNAHELLDRSLVPWRSLLDLESVDLDRVEIQRLDWGQHLRKGDCALPGHMLWGVNTEDTKTCFLLNQPKPGIVKSLLRL